MAEPGSRFEDATLSFCMEIALPVHEADNSSKGGSADSLKATRQRLGHGPGTQKLPWARPALACRPTWERDKERSCNGRER